MTSGKQALAIRDDLDYSYWIGLAEGGLAGNIAKVNSSGQMEWIIHVQLQYFHKNGKGI